MKSQEKLLFLALTIYPTLFFPAVDGYKGKLFGEDCEHFSDCGKSSKSWLACLSNICQCHPFQYYEEQLSMCVSYVGQQCDPIEPTDGLPEIKCGENAVCAPKLHEKFGRCQCARGYRRDFENKCVAEDNIKLVSSAKYNHNRDKGDANSHHQMLQGASRSQPERSNEIIPFPFSGSTTNNSRSQSHLILIFITLLLPILFSKFILT